MSVSVFLIQANFLSWVARPSHGTGDYSLNWRLAHRQLHRAVDELECTTGPAAQSTSPAFDPSLQKATVLALALQRSPSPLPGTGIPIHKFINS